MAPLQIRKARPGDEMAIVSLLRALAEYEKLTADFRATPEIVTRDYLGAAPMMQCELAFDGKTPVGIATWYWTYSSFAAARGLYLEDLFVHPDCRGRGFGKALLSHLAAILLKAGGTRMEWAVLTWNKPSIAFYESLGAQAAKDWFVYRLDGEALTAMASSHDAPFAGGRR